MADGAAHVGNVQDATLPATLRFAGHTGPLDESARPVALGRYEVREILGHGGFGSVYLGFDTQLRRKVAIKVPRYEGLDALGGAVQFLQEARRLAQLNHPGIVTVHDVGVEGTQCYIVSEYIEGTNLSAWLKQSRPTFEQTARIVAAVAEALAYAHSHGIVHRDVKPGNVLLTGELVPILVDFGLALSEDEASQAPRFRTVGTPPYSSPEQERGEGHRIDGRTDVYSLGVVLYQMLTGRLPFRADELDKLRRQICEDDPQPPRQLVRTIPRELERICLKAMAKRISDRYSTAGDMAEELRLAAGSLPPMGLGESRVVAAAGSSAAPPASHVSGSAALGSAVLSDSREVVRIVPKGLRSFGAEDSEFFLQLLPGPRDRDGLPDSVHFWKQRIESSNPETNFAVGLIYGPSGCGKSSFVKAGLLPRVDDRIASVYVEATREDTEARLTKGLRRVCPELDPARSLKDTLAALRRSRARADRQKVLIVLDQFEQWLHVHGEDMEKTELVAALRQADGEHVQVILMVRDDFWLGITRLFD
jgi:serine/threonine protein kinase